MERKTIFFFICFVFTGLALFAQSNVLIDQLLEEQQATFGKSIYMVLSAAELVPANAAVDTAMKKLADSNWNITKAADAPITLGEVAYILMKAFDMQGGVMYSLFPGPRYACREFEYRDFIRKSPYPDRTLTGAEVMQIIAKVLSAQEAAK
ncbi:MAG: hypothetical protein JW904_08475 [Spirochaetales bacterium]|nr:hypothetical protein [Spirochaetales bacterium]